MLTPTKLCVEMGKHTRKLDKSTKEAVYPAGHHGFDDNSTRRFSLLKSVTG